MLDERFIREQVSEVSETALTVLDSPNTPEVSPAFARFQAASKKRKHTQNDLTQAKAIQRIAHKTVLALEQDLDSAESPRSRAEVASALRSAIQAWDLARDAARIARNRPLPGSLRPEAKPKKSKVAHQTFTEAPAPITKPIA